MATLQSPRRATAYVTGSRARQPQGERVEPAHPTPVVIPEPVAPSTPSGVPYTTPTHSERLSELDQRHLLLQTAAVYEGWHLVSVQNRPENGTLVAYLVRNRDHSEPVQAIREGRAMQIIMDAVGDMKVTHPRHKAPQGWQAWLVRLIARLTA
ncbi:MAG: hypothetical protein IT324_15785 [Anaerolineae bacterium]|nr:hypothetical protein [Anaerolineae bacterium]